MAFNLPSALASIAPTLATMLGGPLAGTAVASLTRCFGLAPGKDVAADTDAVSQAIAGGNLTPEVIARLREADLKHTETLKQQDIDLQKINKDYEKYPYLTHLSDGVGYYIEDKYPIGGERSVTDSW